MSSPLSPVTPADLAEELRILTRSVRQNVSQLDVSFELFVDTDRAESLLARYDAWQKGK